MMLRQELTSALKQAVLEGRERRATTVRLILAAIRDRDVAAQAKGRSEGIDDDSVADLMRTMIAQRREAMRHHEEGGQCALAEQEREEIGVIGGFLPVALSETEAEAAIDGLIEEIGACCVKDIGRTMSELKGRYAGRMDFSRACSVVKDRLA